MDRDNRALSFDDVERQSGTFKTVPHVSAAGVLDLLREITGEEHVAVVLFAAHRRPAVAAAYPLHHGPAERLYSLTHRLVSWLSGVTRAFVTEVPTYLHPWFPSRSVVVVPICTPDWHAGSFVVTRASAVHASELRTLAAELGLRLEHDDRRARLATLRSSSRSD